MHFNARAARQTRDNTIGTVTRAITNLRLYGFLKSESLAGGALTYFLTLPTEGLHALLIAPSRNATPVPASRAPSADCKLVEFEFEDEHFLVEEAIKNQILNEIPKLYSQKKIKGDARKKTIGLLLKEIFYYVAKGRTKCLDSCQLKRFYTARKLCLNGVWDKPKGLKHKTIMAREGKWQKIKIEENKKNDVLAKILIETLA